MTPHIKASSFPLPWKPSGHTRAWFPVSRPCHFILAPKSILGCSKWQGCFNKCKRKFVYVGISTITFNFFFLMGGLKHLWANYQRGDKMDHLEGKTTAINHQPERIHSQEFQNFRDSNKWDLHRICLQSGAPPRLWFNLRGPSCPSCLSAGVASVPHYEGIHNLVL